MMDMLKRVNANRRLSSHIRERSFFERRQIYNSALNKKGVKYKEASKEELAKLRAELHALNRKRTWIMVGSVVAAIGLTCLLFVLMFKGVAFLFNHHDPLNTP